MDSKGFLTVATGKDIYFQIAVNLLRSYRHFSADPLPFAIITDRENAVTAEFDDVVLLPNASCSYLDKLELFKCLLYDTSIFVDADCLAYGDLNEFFRYFEDADDFCCFGRTLPLDDKTGWFEYDNLGLLQSQVDYVVGLHGGVYYMRRTEACRKVFEDAKRFALNYADYGFKGRFTSPGDEPLIALSMAVNHMQPIPFPEDAMFCYWEHEHDARLDLTSGRAEVMSTAQRVRLVHWGTRFCEMPVYQKQTVQLELLRARCSSTHKVISDLYYDTKIAIQKTSILSHRICNKVRKAF